MGLLSCIGYAGGTACCIKYGLKIRDKGLTETAKELIASTHKLTDGKLIDNISSYCADKGNYLIAKGSESMQACKVYSARKAYLNPDNTFSIKKSPSEKALTYFSRVAEYQKIAIDEQWEKQITSKRSVDLMKLPIPSFKIILSAYFETALRIVNVAILVFVDLFRVFLGKADFGLTKANYKKLGDLTDALDYFREQNASLYCIKSAVKTRARQGA
jgi:hypothetical protein